MGDPPDKLPDDAKPTITSLNAVALRMFWCFFGPAILCFLTLKLVTSPDGWVSASDLVYLVVLVLTIGTRWLSFRKGDRTNVFGEMLTIDRLLYFTVTFASGATLIWILANGIGNHVVR